MTKIWPCNNCNKVNLEWSENYQKGDRPIEVSSGKEHTPLRCNDLIRNFYNPKELKNYRMKDTQCRLCGTDMNKMNYDQMETHVKQHQLPKGQTPLEDF